MAQLNPRSLVEARDFGDQVYELILSNWGNRGARADQNNGSIIFPPLKTIPSTNIIPPTSQFMVPPIPSLAAIAISPRSLVDRCIIQYTGMPQAQALLKNLPPVPIPEATMLETEQLLAVGAPLIGQQPGPIIIRAVPEEYFNDVFLPDSTSPASGFTPATTFGTALPTDPSGNGGLVFEPPELRLLLYLFPPTLPPLVRAPFNYSWRQLNIDPPAPPGASTLAKVIPVMGRTSAVVDVYNETAAPTDVQVTITGVFRGDAAVSNEVPLVGPINIPGEEGASIPVFNCTRPGLNFILIYLEATTAPAQGAVANLSVTLF